MKTLQSAIAASILFGASFIHAAFVPNPTITFAAPGFNPSFESVNVFDGMDVEYASQSRGFGPSLSTTEGTFIHFDFGQVVAIDQFVNVTRRNPVDVIFTERLIFSLDPIFDASDAFVDLSPAGSNGNGFIKSFGTMTGRYVRWEVLDGALNPGGLNQNNFGSAEMRFLKSSPALIKLAPTVYNGATPFSPTYDLPNAVNGDAGRSGAAGIEYASQGQGANMFVDFDMGAETLIAGFDFYDRFGSVGGNLVDKVNTFDLIFSNDPTFTSVLSTMSFTQGAWGQHEEFAPVNARYVRFDATSAAAPTANSGIQEITFYGVPEPGSGLLLICAGIAVVARRRRQARLA